MDATVTIDMDEKCRECGEDGATDNGLCLECMHRALKGMRMQSQEGRRLQYEHAGDVLRARGMFADDAKGERHIKSVKIDRKSGRIEIVSIEKWGDDNERSWTLRCYEEPRPELPEAMAALEPHVRGLLGLPEDWARGAIGVAKVSWSWSEKTDIKGASVSCHVHLDAADSPLILNTPHLPYEPYSDGGKCLPEDMVEALEELERCVAEYLDGARSQGELFEEAA